MATIINTPQPSNSADNGGGFLLGVILLIIFALIFFIYGLPMISTMLHPVQQMPQINVPNDINVHISK